MSSSSRAKTDQVEVAEILFLGSKILQFPSTTAATAMIYHHKYCEVMKSKPPLEGIADKVIHCSAILFLAGKSTENIRGIRGVLNTVRHLYGLKPDSLELRQYQDVKISIIEREHFMLRVLSFATSVDTSHSHLLNIAKYLRLNNEEVKYAWMFHNDSFFDRRVISTPPAAIACACVFLAIKLNSLLSSKKNHRDHKDENGSDKWWTKLAMKDDLMFYTANWISDISLSRSSQGNR